MYANHNEMVSQDPMISGSWPQCADKWPASNRDWDVRDGKSSYQVHIPYLWCDYNTICPSKIRLQSFIILSRLLSLSPSCLHNIIDEVRCGKNFGDSLCPEGQCCPAWGYCGSGGAWCNFGCQSQCWATSKTSGLAVWEKCGDSFDGKV